MNRGFMLLMPLLSGLLLWLGWPPFHFSFLMFAGLAPLLALEDASYMRAGGRTGRYIWLVYLGMLAWNILTTWWIWNASPEGAAMAIILNSLLLTLPWIIYRKVKTQLGRWAGYLCLAGLNMGVEYLHLNWDAPWPWLNLGNAFASMTDWVQWYEYTGAGGGTLWIWAMNILLYDSLVRPLLKKRMYGTAAAIKPLHAALPLLLAVLPIAISYALKPADKPLDSPGNIVAVQPNIDPYGEKFDQSTNARQLNTLISLSESKIDENTELLVWPETSIPDDLEVESLQQFAMVAQIKAMLRRHPKVKLLAGTTTFTYFPSEEEKSSTARFSKYNNRWLDIFNSALLLDTSTNYMVYHKIKLVPGVEKMPYPAFFGFFEKFALSIGGTSGSMGSSEEPLVFPVNDHLTAAPVICYESIFGEFVGSYLKKGANVICIITNDGWWNNSDGYKQHLMYARLRAIESRKFIVRAANTGVSCFILPSGEVLSQTGFWEPDVIQSKYSTNTTLTFYTRHGDLLYIIFCIIGSFLFIWTIFKKIMKKYSAS